MDFGVVGDVVLVADVIVVAVVVNVRRGNEIFGILAIGGIPMGHAALVLAGFVAATVVGVADVGFAGGVAGIGFVGTGAGTDDVTVDRD